MSQEILEFVESIFSNVLADAFFLIVTSMLAENKFGIIPTLTKKYHKLKNSELTVFLNVTFRSNIQFEQLKQDLKKVFKNTYEKVKLYEDNSHFMDMQIDDSFHIRAYDNDDEVDIRTSEITCHMNTVSSTTGKLLNTLNQVKSLLKQSDTDTIFEEKNFSIFLSLPYKNIYSKFYTPKNLKVKEYELTMSSEERGSSVKLTVDYININSDDRSGIEDVIKQFI